MTKADLAEKIKRYLGYPMVKVELDTSQIIDAIDYSRSKYIKWAVGNATHEVFFTQMLSAGQYLYDMPIGVTEIVAYETTGTSSGINTLFTIDNFLYNQGMFEALYNTAGYTLISYHIARDFLETVRKYSPDKYNYKYHRYSNQLEIHPAPSTGNALQVTNSEGEIITVDSPGFILLRAYMIEGSSHSSTWEDGDSDNDFYESTWILDYSIALCKITLGNIRRKFANFASIGNTGISLDGDTLVSEGKEERERLEESLKLEECYTGLGILIG
jgi:hypothetical protein